MTATNEPPALPPVPGDRPPARRLSRPPSDRYAPREGGDTGERSSPASPASRASALRSLVPSMAVGAVTSLLLVLIGGVLAERSGLLAIAGIGGAVVGLLAANAAVSPDGLAPPAMSRGRATRLAIGLGIAVVAAGALGTWGYGRLEGGVMDPLSYLWETMGLLVPAQAAIAAAAAAWGAGAGPVRGRG